MLRTIGLIDSLAILAVFAPNDWIACSHEMLGMGEFPDEPIAGYLARSTSFWYVSYGALLWFISYDLEKYSRLITFLATMLVVQGVVVFGTDLSERLPIWWTVFEGPCCSGFGVVLLVLQRRTDEPKEDAGGG